MIKEKIYLSILGILIILSIILVGVTFKYTKDVTYNKMKLENIKTNGNKLKKHDKYKYVDMVNSVKVVDDVDIKNIGQKNDKNIVYVQAEMQVPRNKIYDTLNSITNKDNVKNIESIKVQQGEEDMVQLDVNIGFLKNK